MHIVALRLFDARHPRAIRVDQQNLEADTAELGRSGQTQAVGAPERLLPGYCSGERSPRRAVRRHQTQLETLRPLSAENASVVPSGDHHGWRLSPGWLVT